MKKSDFESLRRGLSEARGRTMTLTERLRDRDNIEDEYELASEAADAIDELAEALLAARNYVEACKHYIEKYRGGRNHFADDVLAKCDTALAKLEQRAPVAAVSKASEAGKRVARGMGAAAGKRIAAQRKTT